MKERPIIFSGDGVLGILKDRKTQTRRVIKFPPTWENSDWFDVEINTQKTQIVCHETFRHKIIHCPYGLPGSKLWARETWAPMCRVADPFCSCDEEEAKVNHYIEYKADTGNLLPGDWPEESREDEGCPKWRPSIFMPRWASRITLEIVRVRVERLQDITEADAFAEGISGGDWLGDPVGEYSKLWDLINSKRGYPWSSNCWVWILEFKRLENA